MAFAQAANAGDDAIASTIAATFGSNIATGSVIVAAVSKDGASPIGSVSDSLGNSYTQYADVPDDAHNQSFTLFYAKNTIGGACTVTHDLGGGAGFRRIAVAEFTGLETSAPFDQVASTDEGTTATGVDGTTSASITPSVSNCDIVAVIMTVNGDPTIAAGTGYTERTETAMTSSDLQIESFTQGAAAAINGKWTIGTAGITYCAVVASFKPTAAAVTPTQYWPTQSKLRW